MANMAAVDIAFRQRCATLVVATTGSITMSATTDGYARATGSFLDDGLRVGMEVVPAGFTQTAPATITEVTALAIKVKGGRTVQTAGAGRSLTVGLPPFRVYENNDFTPIPDRQYVEMELVPATSSLRTIPAQSGTREETGLYVVRWYGLANTGVLGLRTCIEALRSLFTPGTTLTAGSDTLRVRNDVAPFSSQVTNRPSGYALAVLTIPWRVSSQNAIAA